MLAMGPGNPPEPRALTGHSVQFSSRPSQNPDTLSPGGVVTQMRQRKVGLWLGWIRTAIPTIRFIHRWLQLSI